MAGKKSISESSSRHLTQTAADIIMTKPVAANNPTIGKAIPITRAIEPAT